MSASSFPCADTIKALPIREAKLDGRTVRALVDTGCSKSLVCERLVRGRARSTAAHVIRTTGGGELLCKGSASVEMHICGRWLKLECLALPSILAGVDVVIGMDAVCALGGVTVRADGSVEFGDSVASNALRVAAGDVVPRARNSAPSAAGLRLSDPDFEAVFDGAMWQVRWRWAAGEPQLTESVSCYGMPPESKDEFYAELDQWINNGWLVPADDHEGPVLPLMAVEQPNKGKVRPVIDYRQLNEFVSSHTAAAQVCAEKLRLWRQRSQNASILDLRRAYLQVGVERSLWRYQVVRVRGRKFYLTRLGFGLNSAPKIMSRIVSEVLSLSPAIKSATDHYIDDVYVDESVVSASSVADHLRRYGLVCKPAVPLVEARVLGLQLYRNMSGGVISWKRGNALPSLPSPLTKRELFSVCGKLTGHYPVAGWLRVACSFVKRHSEGSAWSDAVGEVTEQRMR